MKFLSVLTLFSLCVATAQSRLLPTILIQNSAVNIFLLLGSVFILAAGISMMRFPDFYTRAHASSKLITLGGASIFIAAGIAFSGVELGNRLLLVVLFFLLTAPLSTYAITRAGYLRGYEPFKEPGSVDEWDELGGKASDIE